MSDLVHLPRGHFNDNNDLVPCWIATTTGSPPQPSRPIIRCQCGMVLTIELHHVHADGRVTNSFYHRRPTPEACGWHVYLVLDDWIGLEFLPENPND